MTAARLPHWLKVPLGQGDHYKQVRQALAAQGLHTVCVSAHCPNLGECWSAGTATFMILGTICTRSCGFCAVDHGTPALPDPDEPDRILAAVTQLGLRYVVITSVTRDDLQDGGASHYARVLACLKDALPDIRVEVLIPDFEGRESDLHQVLDAAPHILNHNVETVPRLYSLVRPQAIYARSLELLTRASRRIGEAHTKSGMMLGMGETRDEILDVFRDLRKAGVGRLTIGQYLQPSRHHLEVVHFIPPDAFRELESIAFEHGFSHVAAGPLVRSSYHAEHDANGI